MNFNVVNTSLSNLPNFNSVRSKGVYTSFLYIREKINESIKKHDY